MTVTAVDETYFTFVKLTAVTGFVGLFCIVYLLTVIAFELRWQRHQRERHHHERRAH